ncbi:MAG: hypothetical protein LBU18_06665 [Treponema sp.]|jgi:hypothetical protein|nr:hypothetical protein [Treponema sp.]
MGLRAPAQKGIKMHHMGCFLGQLILRGFDQAEGVYHALQCRFNPADSGRFRVFNRAVSGHIPRLWPFRMAGGLSGSTWPRLIIGLPRTGGAVPARLLLSEKMPVPALGEERSAKEAPFSGEYDGFFEEGR